MSKFKVTDTHTGHIYVVEGANPVEAKQNYINGLGIDTAGRMEQGFTTPSQDSAAPQTSAAMAPAIQQAATARNEQMYPHLRGATTEFLGNAMLGYGDEVMAGISGALNWVASGGSTDAFNQNYNNTLQDFRSTQKNYEQQHPVESTAVGLGGLLATVPLAGPLNVIRGPAAVSRGAPLVAKGINAIGRGAAQVGNSALTGLAYGTGYGFGSGEGGFANRAQNASDVGAWSAALGAAAPVVVGAVKGAVGLGRLAFGRPVQALRGATVPGREASRQVSRAVTADAASRGETPQQSMQAIAAAQAQGVPMTALDVGESTRDLGRAAANISPQGRDILGQMVTQRLGTQGDRVIDTISQFAPGINAPQMRDRLAVAAERINRPAYDQAYKDGARGIWNQQLQSLTVSPDVQAAIKDASRIGANAAATRGQRPPVNPFTMVNGTLNPSPNVSPTLEFWDHVKRSLDGQIGVQTRAGNKEYSSQLTALKTQLVGILDKSVPSYATARQGASAFFGADNALDAGAAFVRRTGDNEAARKAIAKMNDSERKLFAEGFATALINDVRNVPDRYTVINKIFQSPAARERFDIALGPQATNAMEANLRLEAIMDMGRRAVTGNSTTARQQLAAQALLGGAAGAVVNGDPLDPRNLIYAALAAGVGKGTRNLMTMADQQMARRIAEMLASNDPKVVQNALSRVSQSTRMMQQLRVGHAYITRALLPFVGQQNENQ